MKHMIADGLRKK